MDDASLQAATESDSAASTHAIVQSQQDPAATDPAPCLTCGPTPGSPSRFVYALGQIELRFPSPAVEKEFAQVGGRENAESLTDRQMLKSILGRRENRYLARHVCWILTVEGLETYILTPRDPSDIDLLVEAVRPTYEPSDMDLVVGVQGPVASPEMCNGLMLPIVVFDQIYSFDRATFIKSIPKPAKARDADFAAAASEMLDRIMLLADNAGAMDEHRALNFLAVRYPRIYEVVAENYDKGASFSAVEVRLSQLSNVRRIVDVIFSFTNRSTDVTEKQFVRVDVTEKFPYLVTKLSPYFDR